MADRGEPGTTGGGGRVLRLDEEYEGEESPTECKVKGCTRDGKFSRKIRPPGSEEPPTDHYVCQYHYRLFWGVRLLVIGLVVIGLLVAFFYL